MTSADTAPCAAQQIGRAVPTAGARSSPKYERQPFPRAARATQPQRWWYPGQPVVAADRRPDLGRSRRYPHRRRVRGTRPLRRAGTRRVRPPIRLCRPPRHLHHRRPPSGGMTGTGRTLMSKRAIPTWAVLAVCCIAQFMVVLDVSIVNVALPKMRADLELSATGQQWIINAYTLTFAGFLLLGGRAADLFGRRRVF